MPKVSVIIPVYGVEKYIERCARSLFEQTLDDIEYLFIDDCTPDKSVDVLKQVLEEYPQRKVQVTIHRMEKNSGQAAVRNWGMQHVTGEYYIHCDSDDWIDIDMYRLMYEEAKREKADISICDFVEENKNRKKVFKGCNSTEKWKLIGDLCSMQTSWSECNKLVRTRLLHDNEIFYPNGNMGEDMAVIMQLMIKADRIAYVPQQLYHYYINPQSITHELSEDTKNRNYQQLLENVSIVLSAFTKWNLAKKYHKELEIVKWNVRLWLWDLAYMPKYRKVWKETFPELFPSFLMNPYVSIEIRLKFFLTYIALYPRKK